MPHTTVDIDIHEPARMKTNSFEKNYIRLREKEGRLYPAEIIVNLPFIPEDHQHAAEWKLRQESCRRILKYLEEKNIPLKILEVGCGNGWLSHKLAIISNSRVTGIDINTTELAQAKLLFRQENLRFIHGDLYDPAISGKYDIIVFAASLQYFDGVKQTINDAMKLLTTGGEIHITDTHFYEPGKVPGAKERTEKYFREKGIPNMEASYFHHTYNELAGFNYQVLYKPSRFWQFFFPQNPFPWIRVKKEQS